MIASSNALLEKYLPFLTPLCVLSGVLIFSFLHAYAFLVPWIFACITFSSSLGLNIRDMGKAYKNPMPIVVCLLIIQVVMPALAFGVGKLFFTEDIYIITGLLLAFIIPTGIVSLMWVSINKGNVAITLAIILVNTLLAPFVIPLTLKLLMGTDVSLDTVGLMSSLLWMIVIPSVIGILFNQFFPKGAVPLKVTLAPFAKLGLLVIILINSAVIAPFVTQIDIQLMKLMVTLILLALTGYWLGIIISRFFKWDNDVVISLAYTSGIRNNGVGAALAITFFPPQVALPIIVAILFQQVLAAVMGKYFKKATTKGAGLLKVSSL